MSREDVELLRELYQQFARGDFESRRDLLDPHVELERIGGAVVAGPGGPGQWRGLDEFRRGFAEWLRNWEDLRIVPEEFIDLGERVLVLTRQTARGRASGVHVDHRLAELLTLRGGKIVRWEAYWDREEARRAAGIEA